MKYTACSPWITTISIAIGSGTIALFPISGMASNTPPPPPPQPSPEPGITRPSDAACLIVPVADGDEVAQVWSDRPFFLWRNYARGAMYQVDIQRQTDEMEASPIVFQATVAGESSVAYVGTPLGRGEYYQLSALSDTAISQVIPFQVMPEDEYEQVAMELEMAEQEWQAADLLPEEQVLERITFFAERGLWSDAMREAFTVPNPSEELLDYQELVMLSACSG